ncbi:hypothetical protein [Halovulum sp. GXIMD14793]
MRSEIKFVTGMAIFTCVIIAVSLLPGALRVTGHEGDLIHTIDAASRMADGQLQHIDYMTPLGVLAVAPIALFMKLGTGPGMAVLLAQALVCMIFLPLLLLATRRRLEGGVRLAFVVGAVLLTTSLVYGGDNPSTSLALYYNRWAWVLAALIILILMVRPDQPTTRSDAVVLGLSAAGLALLKVTYLLGLLPFGLVAILYDRNWRLLGGALLVALLVSAAATLAFGGIAFWRAYIFDLLATMVSPIRTQPGEDYTSLMGKPAYITMSITALLAVVYWRKTQRLREGLLLLLLFPGLVYIVYQNWGHDPTWLFILALLLLGIPAPQQAKPFMDINAGAFGRILALVLFVIYAPSVINITTSVPRHLGYVLDDQFVPLFPRSDWSDLQVRRDTFEKPLATIVLVGVTLPSAEDAEDAPEPPALLNGEELESCDLSTGLVGWLHKIARDVEQTGLADGKQVMLADILDPLHLFGSFERLEHGAPWYYGFDDGAETAAFLAVPLCPLSIKARDAKLQAIEKEGLRLQEVARTDTVILLSISR